MKTALFSAYVLLALLFLSCADTPVKTSETRIALGTICTINLYENGTQELYDIFFKRIYDIEQLMSTTIPTSDIALINAYAGIKPVAVSPETFNVLQTALYYAKATDGAFNPAIGPLVKLWGIDTDAAQVPTQEQIAEVLELCNWQDVHLYEENTPEGDITKPHVFLAKPGMSLDVGGIAKGYVADELAKILPEYGVQNAVIDLGGNIYALGKNQTGELWKVGIKNPFNSTGTPAIRVDVENNSIVTSGIYERFFERDGIHYHHLLDSKTGYPVNNGIMSVTIISPSSMTADVLSTGVFVMGKEKGMDFLRSVNQKGFYIDTEKTIAATENLKSSLIVLDKDFSLQ
ncbi:MAG: FAD:protein FMN transferase [Spirochaetales bacterium]